uniref:Transposase n=1 Tax=Ditylenchus dipsaci TaxID=166011 RepID=A0A915E342_9BILA
MTRRFWVHPIVADRKQLGDIIILCPAEAGRAIILLSTYRWICSALNFEVSSRLSRSSMRELIGSDERLVVTLRFLATGYSYQSLAFSFRLGIKTVSRVVKETCASIYDVLNNKYLRTPSTPEEWMKIAEGFWKTWNSPILWLHRWKHVQIEKPDNSVSLFYNYKDTPVAEKGRRRAVAGPSRLHFCNSKHCSEKKEKETDNDDFDSKLLAVLDKPTKEDTEEELFGKRVGKALERMHLRKRRQTSIQIEQLLYEFEFGDGI